MTFEYAKRKAEADLLNALHPGTVRHPDLDLELSGSCSFDGGVRGDYNPPTPPRPREYVDQSDPAWVTGEIEDGSDLFWPGFAR